MQVMPTCCVSASTAARDRDLSRVTAPRCVRHWIAAGNHAVMRATQPAPGGVRGRVYCTLRPGPWPPGTTANVRSAVSCPPATLSERAARVSWRVLGKCSVPDTCVRWMWLAAKLAQDRGQGGLVGSREPVEDAF